MGEVPEEPSRAEALPLDEVSLTPFVATPEGAIDDFEALGAVWIACELAPNANLLSCLQDAMPLELADIPTCTATSLSDLQELTSISDLPAPHGPCLIPADPLPSYTVPVSANVLLGGSTEVTMITPFPGGPSIDGCAEDFLAGKHEIPDDCLYGVQRIDIGPSEKVLSLAALLGGEGEKPDEEESEGQAPSVDPDLNPRISEFKLLALNEAGEEILPLTELESGEMLDTPLPAGTLVRMFVESPESDLQSYAIPVNMGESYEEESEKYSGEWFRSWGQLLSGSSNDPQSFNEWKLSPGTQDDADSTLPPDGLAHLFFVQRDGRQGVEWFWFSLRVED